MEDPFDEDRHRPIPLPTLAYSPADHPALFGQEQQHVYSYQAHAHEHSTSQLTLSDPKEDYYNNEDDESLLQHPQYGSPYPPSSLSRASPTPPSTGPPGFPSPAFSTGFSQPSPGLQRNQTSTEAWGRRQRIDPRRAKTVKVKLQKGNFVAEYPVPS